MNHLPFELCLIWAQNTQGAIGLRNTIPWHSKKDFAHFKETTMGAPVIMGRNTWESLPRKPLPGRINIVVSRSTIEVPGAILASSLEDAFEIAAQGNPERVFVMGGAQLYKQTLSLAHRVFITVVEKRVEDADAYAPMLDNAWKLVDARKDADEGLGLFFLEYARKTAL